MEFPIDWAREYRTHGHKCVVDPGIDAATFASINIAQRRHIWPLIKDCKKPGRAIDYGSGPGRFTDLLVKAVDGPAIAYDPCISLMARTEYEDPRVSFFCGDTKTLGKFELVFVWCVLGGLKAPALEHSISEISELLAPGGLLILGDHTAAEQPKYLWQFRRPEFYPAAFEAAGIRLSAVASVPQHKNAVTVFAGKAL